MVTAEIGYALASEEGGNGVVLGDVTSGFPLSNLATFQAQHGSVPKAFDSTQTLVQEVAPVACAVRDARPEAPLLRTHGFELVGNLEIDDDSKEDYSTFLEAVARRVSGATFAKAYCSAARGTTMRYTTYAHSDQAHESWAPRLADLVDRWDAVGPPGLKRTDALRAANATRYAVLSAWRYAGPAPTCRHSHLALLDPASVKPDDVVHFEIRTTQDTYGSNYRLKAPPKTTTTTASKAKAKARARAAPSHHTWWYFPNMARDSEILFFTVFDSSPAFPSPLRIPTVLHSAFLDPTAPPDEPPRRSLDVRLLLAWE